MQSRRRRERTVGRSVAWLWLLRLFVGLVGLAPVTARADDTQTCRSHRGAEAVQACTRLIDANKAKGVERYLQFNDRGGAHQSLGTDDDHRRAIEDFTEAVRLDAKLPYAFINRGVSWANLGAHDRAIEDFAQALRADPKNARAYNNRGGARRDRGEFDSAMADFNKAIELDPALGDARFNRGTLYMQKEEFARAIADYSAVLRQTPKDILALAARGRAWSSQNDDRRARLDFEAALAIPAEDRQSRTVQEAVQELLRALIERRAFIEEEAARKKQALLEQKAAEEQRLALEKQAAKEKRAAEEKQALLEKQAAAEKEKAERLRAELEKKAADAEKKTAREKKAADERQAAAEQQAAREKKAAEQKQAALEKKAAEEKKAALEKQAAQEKKAAEAKQALLEKQSAAEKLRSDRLAAEIEKKRADGERLAALPKAAPPSEPAQAVEERRIGDRMALVIGNAAYDPSLGALPNPTHDAADVAQALRLLGFAVWLSLDVGHATMKETIRRFAEASADAQTAVFFFSGHGFQHGGNNYLAAVDAPITDQASINNHVALNSVMAGLKDHGTRIVIIDACRNNLAVERAAGSDTAGARAILVKRGLGQLAVSDTWSGGGMLLAFATLPGDIASDGAGRNSPFTHAFVKHLSTPNLELRRLFILVRAEVITATGGKQVPHVSDALNGEYVFNPLVRTSANSQRR